MSERGDQLDPGVWWLLGLERVVSDGLKLSSPEAARRAMLNGVKVAEGPRIELYRVEDLEIAGRPARRYHPGGEGLPLVVYFHGGGWVVGDLRTHDHWCRRLAHEAQVVVVAVDYRLAPEHPFPAGLNDAVACFEWCAGHAESLGADPARVSIGGDSAGANLSASACLVLRDQDGPMPFSQLLIYPAVDLRRQQESLKRFGSGFLLERTSIDWYIQHYGASDEDPLASPLLADTHTDLPPALVVPAGFDPLRDDGDAYASALRAGAVDVTLLHIPDMVHGFLQLNGVVPAAARASSRVAAAAHTLLHGASA